MPAAGAMRMKPLLPLFPLLLLLLLHSRATHGALTHYGAAGGQTLAPKGADHLHYMYGVAAWRAAAPAAAPRRRSRKSSRKITRGAPPLPATIYNRRPPAHTLSEVSPFYTLRDYSCARVDARRSYVLLRGLHRARADEGGGEGGDAEGEEDEHGDGDGDRDERVGDDGDSAVVRHVSAAELSKMFDRAGAPPLGGRENTIVLFHGGASCEWSRRMWGAWVSATRRMRSVCMVAIDGARDPMLNNNLMVFGFPTVMRIRSEAASESFRGNRTADALVEWIVRITGIAPMEGPPGGGLQGDLERFGAREAGLTVVDVGVHSAGGGVDWALVGANLVSGCNVLWVVYKFGRLFFGKRRKEGGADDDGTDDGGGDAGGADDGGGHDEFAEVERVVEDVPEQ